MAMNLNSINSQSTAQLYQNNQPETTRSPQQNTNQDTTQDAGRTRVDISQKSRDLQAQKLQSQKETGEATRAEDNGRTEQNKQAIRQEAQNAGNQGNQPQPIAGTRDRINLVA